MTMNTPLQPVELTVSPEMIQAYATLTDDFNPIHLDPDFAAQTPMGGCIAHGTLSVCLLWQALLGTFGDDARSRVALDVRFVKPVRAGETLRAGGEPKDGAPGCYTVWVRAADGIDRVVGTAQLLPPKEIE